jgi:protein TonB
MYSLLNSRAAPHFRASRGAVLVGIVVLHMGAMALALTMKGPRPDAQPHAPPIQVMLTLETERSQLPDIPVQVQEVSPPQVTVPIVEIDLPVPAPTAITVMAVATPAIETAPVPAPLPVSDGNSDAPIAISEARWVRKPIPAYPKAASQARAQGVVQVRALVDINGHAREARVHRSSGFAALDRAACEAVLAALFRPYLHNGVPRSVDVIVPITFALANRGGGGRAWPRGRDRDKEELELDVRGEDHHAMRGHAEELGSLGAAALHVGE